MIIPINDKYRINSDKHQWFVQQYRGLVKDQKTGEKVESWKGCLFYTDLSKLVTGLSERMLRESNADTLALALVEVETISRTLREALSPIYEVKEPRWDD